MDYLNEPGARQRALSVASILTNTMEGVVTSEYNFFSFPYYCYAFNLLKFHKAIIKRSTGIVKLDLKELYLLFQSWRSRDRNAHLAGIDLQTSVWSGIAVLHG